ncbi:MAG TPA: hypothetical protein GX710_05885 [Clostridiales bacterium]|nr:hypothetical protein [Clostridiales bacterium]
MRRKFGKGFFKYNVMSDCIIFWCSGIDENKDATVLLNSFLFNISKEYNVFLVPIGYLM